MPRRRRRSGDQGKPVDVAEVRNVGVTIKNIFLIKKYLHDGSGNHSIAWMALQPELVSYRQRHQCRGGRCLNVRSAKLVHSTCRGPTPSRPRCGRGCAVTGEKALTTQRETGDTRDRQEERRRDRPQSERAKTAFCVHWLNNLKGRNQKNE
ncbi:hypothetical protein HJG60_007736 [Phyllostomus discolor]|uniref:Uncharacterized protein n=1 Tax=Phyllostomus discolor TaxID=89673 RepID=A0A834BDM5_9CHIR|nr:hypothetical protein HJG60_007736 [Phyllostomus discolor]